MRQDPVSGTLQTDEQAAAAESQQKEGFFARVEGRFQQLHERLTNDEQAAAAEKARLDALEQEQKAIRAGNLENVIAHFQNREKDIVLRHNELEAEHDLLQKNFDALLARLNGQVPGFYEALKAPPPAPVVVEEVAPPPAQAMQTSAEKRQARKDAAEEDRP